MKPSFYEILVGIPEEKISLDSPKCRFAWEHNIKANMKIKTGM
jgi:hypothetical protein